MAEQNPEQSPGGSPLPATHPAPDAGLAPPPGADAGRLVTIPDRDLSLWQSAAEHVARTQIAAAGDPTTRAAVAGHPLVQGVTAHVKGDKKGGGFFHHPVEWLEERTEHEVLATLSKLHLHHAQAGMAGDEGAVDKILDRIENLLERFAKRRRFSNMDAGWAETEVAYVTFMLETDGQKVYRDWKAPACGNGNLAYSVIPWQLPDDARVAIIGDWGTGMGDARAMLEEILRVHRPAVVIHLGDIYYSGTKEECAGHFADVFDSLFQQYPAVPVFNIPGNHDYYCWGVGFYDLLDNRLHSNQPTWRQDASYFCLRSRDGQWQFLGMDTGQSDGDPLAAKDPKAAVVRDSERAWLQDKLSFPGRTVLLSHHQVFTAHSTINVPPAKPFLNDGLLNIFAGHLDRIAAWFWGHEHSLCLFQDGLFGLRKGRLLGASAFEAMHEDDPYAVKHPEVPEQLFNGAPARAGITDGYYNHSYAIVDLARQHPEDPVSVSYYQIPSWSGPVPKTLPDGQLPLLATELLD